MITVMVVDDSALMRKAIRGMLEDAGGFEVATARNGADAIEQLPSVRPDVITLDVNMPEMDGLTCLSEIMRTQPTPVVMLSSLTERGALTTLEAMELGAVDYLAKPGGTVSLNVAEVGDELVRKVRDAARTRPRTRSSGLAQRMRGERDRVRRTAPVRATSKVQAVLIGSSTGGPALVTELLSELPGDFPAPIVVAQHMPAGFTRSLAARIDGVAQIRAVELTSPASLQPGTAYICRGDADGVISRRGGVLSARSVPASASHRWHPSVDRLVESALEVVPAPALLGVLLTGMGDDGAQQMTRISTGGGRTIAESQESAVIWGMPGQLVAAGGATAVLPAGDICAQLMKWI
ncbi:chemotaxis response regulator protein-glutamate methylesterase 3 [Kineosporia sp. NBRC 101677]|uniref:chemotaxis-specific protein-glutamate methyltransferase CheB n=1 Tax=Kineosporia sp. NBRC 101677 TaxID=3032197 RepID=UPI0024A5ED04|nr:chemotaxis-specific protein-glutamate methyltransferase CheB [Kineosporia sp. NBRC 101677]GLY17149.1 chemotaxis response regulator protein-glutamate methylesterase 3 [Kineosporia sp. NBRC 101677]